MDLLCVHIDSANLFELAQAGQLFPSHFYFNRKEKKRKKKQRKNITNTKILYTYSINI